MENKILRSTDIRERNEKIILRLMRDKKHLSQSETVLATGLKAPSVFRIFGELEKKGYILLSSDQTLKEAEDKKGRKPSLFSINPQSLFAIGIDFWAGSAAVSVEDFGGNTVHTDLKVFDRKINADEAAEILLGMVEKAIKKSGIGVSRLLGIGLGAPGRVDMEKGQVISYPRISGMENFPISERFASRFGVPVFLQNNSALIALTEQRYGQGRGVASLLTLLIRSGVGGAFIENGRLFTAHGRSAMEVGHMSLACDDRLCSCGSKGCLEAYISEDAILNDLNSTLGLKSFEDFDAVHAKSSEAVESELAPALEVFERGIRNLYQLFSPDAFLVVSRSAS
ncbi:ROK family transcriptional regulator [Treponema sp.]